MSSAPRESTDLESAPLLAHDDDAAAAAPDAATRATPAQQPKGFLAALTDPQRELSVVEKVLTAIAFIFLIIAATFIGLFAAERHKGSRAPPHVPWPTSPTWTTSTVAVSSTVGHTVTVTQTATLSPAPSPTPSVCLTPDCVQLSAAILGALDTDVDPCDDFYGYATGGWAKRNPLPKDKARWGSFNELAIANQRLLKDVLEAPLPVLSPTDASPEEQAGLDNLVKLQAEYGACLNETHLNALGDGPLVPLLKDVRRLFPAGYPTPKELASLAQPEDDANVNVVVDQVETDAAVARVKALIASASQPEIARATGPLRTAVEDLAAGADEGSLVKSHSKELTDVLAFVHSIGADALFSFELEGDAAVDPQRQILWLYQNGLGLPAKEYYEEKSVTKAYEAILAGLLERLFELSHVGAKSAARSTDDADDAQAQWEWPHLPWDPAPDDPDDDAAKRKASTRALAKHAAAAVLAFEHRLARAQAEPEKLSNPTFAYNPFMFRAVAKLLPLDLAAYVSSFAPRNFPVKIIVTSPAYVKRMTEIVEHEEDYVLQSYFLVRVALKYARNLGDTKVRQSSRSLGALLSGVSQQPERSEVCIQYTRQVLPHLAGAEYVSRAFGGSSKASAEAIIVSIIDEFKSVLGRLEWLDKPSAAAAIRKANAISPMIGFPLYPNTTSPVALRAYYGRQPVDKDAFFDNALAAERMELQRGWQQALGNLRNPESWLMSADEVNAYESPSDNQIVFPAGILQPPFFAASWPKVLNYGAFGAVAAHELTHAYDNQGSQYDHEGRFRQWFTNSTLAAFTSRAQCIAEQYSKFYIVGPNGEKVHVQGNLTNGEDIGDSGLRVAWNAWKTSLASSSSAAEEDAKVELRLPGLQEFTDDQLFFLAFGRIWASASTPAAAKAGVLTDPHSPNQFRVAGTLRNFEQFATSFHCKKGDRMRLEPEERCALW